ncbi:MAG: hypothetical protein AAGK32_04260, partial [Actinomycetota bacterium]
MYAGTDGGASCGGAGDAAVGVDGDAVTYCFVVTNTGDTTLTDVLVDDVTLSPAVDQDDMSVRSGDLASLLPGETVVLYLETAITATLTNTASTSATAPVGADPTDSDTADVTMVAPAITVDKTVYAGHDGGAGCAGAGESVAGEDSDAVTYCFRVDNTGDVAVTDVRLTDPLLDGGVDETDVVVTAGDLGSLPAGESLEGYVESTISGPLLNTVTAAATAPAGPDPADTDTASVSVLAPGITLDKTVYEGDDAGASCPGSPSVTVLPGDTVTYCFEVINSGETPLDVAIDDPSLSIDETDMTVLSGSLSGLGPGDTVLTHVTAAHGTDLLNTATATGTSPAGARPSVEDDASVNVVDPDLGLSKTVYLGHDDGASCEGAESAAGEDGAAVTYCFVVENRGDVTLTDVLVDDGDLGIDQDDLSLLSGSLASLPAGDRVIAYVEVSIDGSLVNTATASATAPAGPDPTDTDTASVTELVPGLTVDKTVYAAADDGASCAGAGDLATGESGRPLTWCFSVTNTGEVELDIELDDAVLGLTESDMTLLSGSLTGVAPGDTAVLYAEGAIDSDLTNTVTATGTTAAGTAVSDRDDAQVDEVAPAIRVDKTVYLGTDSGASCAGSDQVAGEHGSAVTYCFVVTNTGDVPVSDVTVDDPQLGIGETDMDVVSGDLTRLAPGEQAVLAHEATITGDLVNTATATAVPLDADGVALSAPTTVSDDDQATVDLLVPGIAL